MLKDHSWHMAFRYPFWQCQCGFINRFMDTFAEICRNCKTDHTLDWKTLIVDDEVKKAWDKSPVPPREKET